MYSYIAFTVLLTLFSVSFSQPLPSAVFCDRDGLCLTEKGNQAVCGTLGSPKKRDLPPAVSESDGYKIRIDMLALLLDSNDPTDYTICQESRPQPELEPLCDPIRNTCPARLPMSNPLVCDAGNTSAEARSRTFRLLASASDPENPPLGGKNCVTRAFKRRCRLCCARTAFKKSLKLFAERGDAGDSQRDHEYPASDSGEESNDDCRSRRPLGLFRSPTPLFYRVCNRYDICNPRTGCER